jgi:phosphate starvation-inducible PhoH-like protein
MTDSKGFMTINTAQTEITFRDDAQAAALFGQYNRNLKEIEKAFSAKILARGEIVRIQGDPDEVERVRALFEKLLTLIEKNHCPSAADVRYLIDQVKAGVGVEGVLSDVVRITHWGEEIRAKTVGQHRYIQAVRDAVAQAIDYLKREKVKRIILTRPAVEAGEELGFLPGDILAKVSPYLRPLYDAMFDMIPSSEFEKLTEYGRIEMAPLAFMRGRTLNNSFVILDEAQNTTSTQMKMFLTRLGFNSKVIITGDITQVDLENRVSGLISVQDVLCNIDGISFVYLDTSDVVRHPLVARIIDAYEQHEKPRSDARVASTASAPPAVASARREPARLLEAEGS